MVDNKYYKPIYLLHEMENIILIYLIFKKVVLLILDFLKLKSIVVGLKNLKKENNLWVHLKCLRKSQRIVDEFYRNQSNQLNTDGTTHGLEINIPSFYDHVDLVVNHSLVEQFDNQQLIIDNTPRGANFNN